MIQKQKLAYLAAALSLTACARGVQNDPTETVVQEVVTEGQIFGNTLPAKTVVLTYDDGPDEHTLEIAQYYADQGIHLTFFENGRRYCKVFDANGVCTTPNETRDCDNGQSQAAVPGTTKYYPESLIDKLLALGHRVANHTQDHCHLQAETNMTNIAWELQTTQDLIEKHICDNVFLFRAPYGEWDAATVKRIKAGAPGLDKLVGPVNWDIDGEDWSCWQTKVSPEDCAAKYLAILEARPNKNGIFLMHDRPEFNVGYAGPLLMAKIIVPKLKADGYKFANMDDVLKLTPKPGGSGCPVAAMDAGAPTADAGAPTDATPTDPGTTADAGAGGAGGSAGGAGGSSSTAGAGGNGAGGNGTGGNGTGDGTGGSGTVGNSGAGGSGASSGGTSGSSPTGQGTGGSKGSTTTPTSGHGSTGCVYGGTPTGSRAPALFAIVGLGLLVSRRRHARRS